MNLRNFLHVGSLLSLLAVAGLVACGDDDTSSSSSSSGTGASSSSSGAGSSSSSSGTGASSSGSSGSSSSSSGASNDAGEDFGAPTFTNVYEKILSGTCTGCHGATHVTGLAMGTKELAYTNLVGTDGVLANGVACNDGTRKRVVPSNAEQSLIWKKINHTADCGSTMPLGGTKLAQARIDFVKAWIDAGAKND